MHRETKYRLSRRAFGSLLVTGSVGASLPLWLDGCATIGARGSSRTVSPDGLSRSSPESQGVDPRAIPSFLDDVAALGLELDSFMLYRHGQVVAEGWWWPYRADRVHMMHSLTKSVMVSGVALAMEEGRFGVDDKVISFFKDDLPAKIDDKLAAMTVRDLLTMRTGHAVETSGALWRPIHTSWAAEFFKIPIVYQPGTKFVYTSAASYMLSAIVTKTTGQPLRDYLEPRFFKPLGIRGLQWDLDPSGKINPGGNGLSWTTADSLKLGAVYAQNGMWEGRRILPAKWVREASTAQVETGEYGYQWWLGPNKAYYALGLFVQMSIVFPEHDAVLAVTAAINGSKLLLPTLWKHFPAAFGDPTPVDAKADQTLRERCSELRLLPQLTHTTSAAARRISGRTFEVASNEDDVRSLRFEFAASHCIFSLTDARGEHQVKVGLRDWIEGDTGMTGNKLHHEYQPDVMRVVAGARWVDEQTFEMTWQFVESAFRDRVVCRFDGDSMTLDRSVNVNEEATKLATLHGKLN
jgi:CubicO group peptidase (beta-lactamase class C family)